MHNSLDRDLEEIYAGQGTVAGYAAAKNISLSALKRRARQLGLTTSKQAWSDEEIELLEQYGHLPSAEIQDQLNSKGFFRTPTAIENQLKRLRIRKSLPYYSARSVAECFGVDPHTVIRWIQGGRLKATRKGSERVPEQGGDIYMIHESAIRDFVLENPTIVNFRKCDPIWLLDLVAGLKIA